MGVNCAELRVFQAEVIYIKVLKLKQVCLKQIAWKKIKTWDSQVMLGSDLKSFRITWADMEYSKIESKLKAKKLTLFINHSNILQLNLIRFAICRIG